jgi:hypothetical protein
VFRSELELYAPIKAFLEGQGYTVKGEVRGCDLVAARGAEPPVIVELKLRFSLGLVLQGVDRLGVTDAVYLAVPTLKLKSGLEYRSVKKLCRRLGLGLICVHHGKRRHTIEVLLDPLPYQPRKNKRRAERLLGEHARRVGDPNRGGASTRLPLITAYRQEALRCAELLASKGPSRVAAIRADAEAPNGARILQQNVYGWFERVERGIYRLTEAGLRDLDKFSRVVSDRAA